MGVIKAATGDALLTFLWVICTSVLGLLTNIIAIALGVQTLAGVRVIIIILLVFFFLCVFSLIAEFFGGASFNPTSNASLYAAGIGGDTPFSMALRFPAQAAGAAGGALAIMKAMPSQYKHMIGGPALKVGLNMGAIAEGLLTFVISFVVLFVILRGPRNLLLKMWYIAIATVGLLLAGTNYTGPSMNPANAFGWAYANGQHNTWEQAYVYWICPFIGSILAALLFRSIFPIESPKQKRA